MGYLYRGSNLVCESCGDTNATKHKCPFGWCRPTALCQNCWSEHKGKWRQLHVDAGCEANSEEYNEKAKHEAEILRNGRYLRCAALTSKRPDKKVKVFFRGQAGDEKAFFMTKEAYHSIPIGALAIIEDYQKFEELEPAQNLDIYSPL